MQWQLNVTTEKSQGLVRENTTISLCTLCDLLCELSGKKYNFSSFQLVSLKSL